MHLQPLSLSPSPQFYISFASNFPWVLQSSQEFLGENKAHFGLGENGQFED